jgi:peptide/nickel transport system permease protein
MDFQVVFLWSDALVWALVVMGALVGWLARRDPLLRAAWGRVGRSPTGMGSAAVLCAFLSIGLLDSMHYRAALPEVPGAGGAAQAPTATRYAIEVNSLLDKLLEPLRTRTEKTYSAPVATRAFSKEMTVQADGSQRRDYPRLRHGGAHLADESAVVADATRLGAIGAALGGVAVLLVAAWLTWRLGRNAGRPFAAQWRAIWRGETEIAWRAALIALLVIFLWGGALAGVSAGYHALGTDKVGQDVLFQVLKSIRTALVIGLVTTLVTLPIGIVLGVAAGYFRGWVDDVIQYLYTTLNSIPGVLLIAAAALMMQAVLDLHPEWFSTSAERADMRLIALCLILGMTSWTGLARLLRGETLKLSQLEYVQAAQAFGVSRVRILARHILPNVMHIVIIALVMDFSGLVLAEAVLSYVGIGVDPSMISFGTMINNARMELSREPVVWWSLAGAFVAMVALVLAANLLADVVRDAFDPRMSVEGGR